MKRKMTATLAAVMAVAMVFTACGSSSASSSAAPSSTPATTESSESTAAPVAAVKINLGTGGTTGTYYAVGGVMATVLNDKLELSNLTVNSTGASKANIQLIDDGEADLATVQNDVMYYAYNGTDLFAEEGAYDTFGTVACLYAETCQIIVRADSVINSVSDLAGKTVSFGHAGSG